MKKFFSALILTSALCFVFTANNAHAAFIWADILNEWSQGSNAQYEIPGGLSTAQERAWVESRVLGASDVAGTTWPVTKEKFFNLGDGNVNHDQGYIDVSFSTPILLRAGMADLAIYEFGGYGPGISEDAGIRVQVANESGLLGSEFTEFAWSIAGYNTDGSQLNEILFDLGDSGTVSRIRVFDIAGALYYGSDIDAVKGLMVTPEPIATVLFLIGGLPIGYSIVRKRRFKV